MKRILTLLACLILTPIVWADDAAPPPIPAGDSSNALPPPVDTNDLTPLPAIPSQGSNNQNPAPVTNIQAVPTDTPVPAPPAQVEVPTATATPEPMAPPTATPEPAAPPAAEEKPAEKEAPAASSPSTSSPQAGDLTDYFPASEGVQWSYEYLKPSAGETAKTTFAVKCASAKTMANGTVRAVFETTGGHQSQDHYSLFNNVVEHTNSGGQAMTGDFAFKLPSKEVPASWSLTDKDGATHKFKAAFGQAQVYQKIYPDCVVVTEKVVKDGKTVNTMINYYAKGIGLVALEVYSPAMKLIQDKSFALVSGPGGGAN